MLVRSFWENSMEAGPGGCGCWALALGSRVSSSVFVSSLGRVQGWVSGHTQPPCVCGGGGDARGGLGVGAHAAALRVQWGRGHHVGGWGGAAWRPAPGLQASCRTVGTAGRRPLGSCVSWGGTPAPALHSGWAGADVEGGALGQGCLSCPALSQGESHPDVWGAPSPPSPWGPPG